MAMVTVLSLVILFPVAVVAVAIVEQGKWTFSLDQDHQFAVVGKTMYKESQVSVAVSLHCGDGDSGGLEISWIFRMSDCMVIFPATSVAINSSDTHGVGLSSQALERFMRVPVLKVDEHHLSTVEWSKGSTNHNCTNGEFKLQGVPHQELNMLKLHSNRLSPDHYHTVPIASREDKSHHPNVAKAWDDGYYTFLVRISPGQSKTKFNAQVTIGTFYGDENYISAKDYPLLIFYGVMGLVYTVYGLVWLGLLTCHWRDLLRVQYWIGAVVLLTVVVYAAMFALHEVVNKTGQSEWGILQFLNLAISLKSSAFLMLILIVCLGFTIAKSLLTRTYYKVLTLGAFNFILIFIMQYSIFFATDTNELDTKAVMVLVSTFSLFFMWLGIIVWIALGLKRTMRILKSTSKVNKLKLYRLFCATLVLYFLVDIACNIWIVIKRLSADVCAGGWKFEWIDTVILNMPQLLLILVIMLLWRPSANNQSYAFSPLLDAPDEEGEDNDGTDGAGGDDMKMKEMTTAI